MHKKITRWHAAGTALKILFTVMWPPASRFRLAKHVNGCVIVQAYDRNENLIFTL